MSKPYEGVPVAQSSDLELRGGGFNDVVSDGKDVEKR